MPEGVAAYPRWDGALRGGTMLWTVAGQEVRRALNNFWSRLALLAVFAYAIVLIATLFQNREDPTFHTKERYLDSLGLLRWGALGLAAVMGGSSLLEDHRRGALELYLSRSVTTREYLMGKIVAVFGLSTFALFLPAVLYFAGSFFAFEEQPDGWNFILFGTLLYSVMWGLLVSGLALGISAVSRSSRGATLLLFGGFAVLEVIVATLLQSITREPNFKILSPFAMVEQQTEWIFGVDAPFAFPSWWGLAVWAILVVIGWGLVAWRHPRVRGEERARG